LTLRANRSATAAIASAAPMTANVTLKLMMSGTTLQSVHLRNLGLIS
jgi:hypothetical protein